MAPSGPLPVYSTLIYRYSTSDSSATSPHGADSARASVTRVSVEHRAARTVPNELVDSALSRHAMRGDVGAAQRILRPHRGRRRPLVAHWFSPQVCVCKRAMLGTELSHPLS